MPKSIVNLITSEKAAQAVSVVEKTLAKKLREAISSQRPVVAKNTYGSLGECYGADETPEFMEPGDNAYQAFYQNALKKFGVTGPQDFKDENTKQQFFNYLDMNWKAQDAVKQQQVPGAAQNGGIDLGTQTQLPAPAMQPRPPQPQQGTQAPLTPGIPPQVCPDPQAHMPPGGAQDPSLAGMSQSGMGPNTADPLGADGDEGDLDNMQQQGQGQDGNDEGSVWGGADGQFGNGPDFGPDPDLEIGDEGEQDDQDDEFGPGNNRDDDDEQGLDLRGDNDGEGDEDVPQDDEFADDDAYNVDHKDFGHGSDDDDSDEDNDEFGSDDSDDDDDGDDDSDRFSRNHSGDDGSDDEDDDDDPDLEIGDDDESDDDDDDEKPSPFPSKKSKEAPKKKKAFGESLKPSDRSRKTRKADFAKATRATGKKETRVHEGEDGEIDDGVTFGENFNFDADNAEDQAYLNEQSMMAQVDPSIAPKLRSARREINKIKSLRDASTTHIKRQVPLAKTREERQALSKIHAQTRQHFRNMANVVKGVHTHSHSHHEEKPRPEMGNPHKHHDPSKGGRM